MENIENIRNSIEELLLDSKYMMLAEKIIDAAGKILCSDLYDIEVDHCQKLLAAASTEFAAIRALITDPSAHLLTTPFYIRKTNGK